MLTMSNKILRILYGIIIPTETMVLSFWTLPRHSRTFFYSRIIKIIFISYSSSIFLIDILKSIPRNLVNLYSSYSRKLRAKYGSTPLDIAHSPPNIIWLIQVLPLMLKLTMTQDMQSSLVHFDIKLFIIM